jgi:CRP-like cAMP-binding protein
MNIEDLAQRLGEGVERKRVRAQEVLFYRGDPTHHLYGVVEGEVRLVRHTFDGAEVSLHRARPGDFFAEASLFSDIYHCDGVAGASSVLMAFSKRAVLDLMARDGQFAQAFCQHLAGQVQKLRSGIELRGIRNAEDRVMAAVSLRLKEGDDSLEVAGAWKNFALDIGLSHEALYRTLKRLEDQGRIKRQDRVITVCKGR